MEAEIGVPEAAAAPAAPAPVPEGEGGEAAGKSAAPGRE
jgi:hypothetical protein